MATLVIGLISAVIAAATAAISGHGLGMILLAYVLGGMAGTLLAGWRIIIVKDDRTTAETKTFLAPKDKTVGPL